MCAGRPFATGIWGSTPPVQSDSRVRPTPANRPAEMTAAKRSFPPPDLRCGTFRFPLTGRFRAHTLFSGHMSAR